MSVVSWKKNGIRIGMRIFLKNIAMKEENNLMEKLR